MNGTATRALGRIARRDILRHRGRSILVLALIALPVAAMVAGIALYRTTTPTSESANASRMGRADLIAYNTNPAELAAYMPPGSVIEAVVWNEGELVVPGARPDVSIRAMDLDGLAAGMLMLIDGRAPHGVAEVAITDGVAALANVGLGGRLEVADGPVATVVGIIENPAYLADRVILLDPTASEIDESLATWLIGLPEGADPEAVLASTVDADTGEQLVIVMAREPAGAEMLGGSDSTSPTILILGALALVEAALIASAAFAVSIRRRQRELGLLAATGATPSQLAAMMLIEGAMLGLVACLVGVVIGLVGAASLTPWLDTLTQRRNPPLVVDPGGISGPMVIGFVAAMIAAIVPARTVARVPVLLALSGRRPPEAPARRNLRVGIVIVGLAAAMTITGATMQNAGSAPASLLLLIGGAVLSTLGFGACAPWLLERLERVVARLPVSGRIAFRDAARARSRSSPIVTAILASCAAVIAIGAWQTSRDAENIRGWRPSLYPDQLAFHGQGAVAAGEELLGAADVVAGLEVARLLVDPENPDAGALYLMPDARDAEGDIINTIDGCGNCNPGAFEPYQVAGAAAAGTPEVLALAHAESAAEDLAEGRAVVLTDGSRPASATTLEIRIFRDVNSGQPTHVVTVPVRLLVAPVPVGVLPQLFLPDDVIEELGLVEVTDAEVQDGYGTYVVRFDHEVTSADFERAREIAARHTDTVATIDTPPVRQGAEFRLMLIGLVLLFAVSVTGIAIALGEAESRAEQRSLLALGADPRLRRRIVAARAAVLALLAGILAVPAGLLPIWGIFVSRGSPLAVPTLEIAGAVLALPILAVLSAWLLSRPIPDWAAFRNLEAR